MKQPNSSDIRFSISVALFPLMTHILTFVSNTKVVRTFKWFKLAGICK